jgi:hypothetical protein
VTSYAPLKGSLAERAYSYLASHIGEWVPNAQMTEAFDSDGSSIIQSLRTALDRKLVERRTEGRLVFWRMPKVRPYGAEPDDELPKRQRTVPAPDRDPSLTDGLLRVRSAFDLAPRLEGMPAEDPEPQADAPAPLAPATEEIAVETRPTGQAEVLRELMAISKQLPRSTRFALWDDGALEIRRDGYAPLLLAVEDTKRLLRYLERLVVEEGA